MKASQAMAIAESFARGDDHPTVGVVNVTAKHSRLVFPLHYLIYFEVTVEEVLEEGWWQLAPLRHMGEYVKTERDVARDIHTRKEIAKAPILYSLGLSRNAIEALVPHMAEDDIRYYLIGICYSRGVWVATDGHRLACTTAAMGHPDHKVETIIPRGAIELAHKLKKDCTVRRLGDGSKADEWVSVHADPEVTIYSPVCDGKFPDFRRVMEPLQQLKSARHDRGRLEPLHIAVMGSVTQSLARLKAARRPAKRSSSVVVIDFAAQSVTGFPLKSETGGALEDARESKAFSFAQGDTDASGHRIGGGGRPTRPTIGFNGMYVDDALSAHRIIDGAATEATVTYVDPERALMIETPNVTTVVMPRRVS